MSYQCKCYGFNASIARLQVVYECMMYDLLIEGIMFGNRLPFCKYYTYIFQWFPIERLFVAFFRWKNVLKSRGSCNFQNWMKAIHALNHYFYFMLHNWIACYQIHFTHSHLKLNFEELLFVILRLFNYHLFTFFLENFGSHFIKQCDRNIHIRLVHLTFLVDFETGEIFPLFDANIYASIHT